MNNSGLGVGIYDFTVMASEEVPNSAPGAFLVGWFFMGTEDLYFVMFLVERMVFTTEYELGVGNVFCLKW